MRRAIYLLFLTLYVVTSPCLAQIKRSVRNASDMKFSQLGDAIDAHDGEIAYFNGTYYLYGTSYGCGFEWGHKDAPFCGFKVYTSKDLINWTDKGELFDASSALWQTRCNGNTYGCFRPHVIYNQRTSKYVLWINVYDNVSGYRVFTSKSPVGPFTEQAEPKLAVNSHAPAGGLNNGDHDTFVDDDGTAYLAYTDWRTGGRIAIEQLSPDYLTGTGHVITGITAGSTEAPSLFKRKGIYYLLYSDPNCGYCAGTGTSYRTASSPMGPWSAGIKISDNSCGGQPSFVSIIKLKSGAIYLFGSDLWNNGAKNEALANYYWAPLSFASNGAINPINCSKAIRDFSIQKGKLQPENNPVNLVPVNDLDSGVMRQSKFTAQKSGRLVWLSISCFKTSYPEYPLSISLNDADGAVLKSFTIPGDSISWSPKNIILHPDIKVKKNNHYSVTVTTLAMKGRYGFLYYAMPDITSQSEFLYKFRIQPGQ